MNQDVVAVVSCTAAIVRPKEGDGSDRAKYFQGITFYEPEVGGTLTLTWDLDDVMVS